MDGVGPRNFLFSGPHGTLKLAFQKAGVLLYAFRVIFLVDLVHF